MLITCKECKNEISDQSVKCIHCGFEQKKSNLGCLSTIFIGIILMTLIFAFVDTDKSSKNYNSDDAEIFSASLDKELNDLLNKFIKANVLYKLVDSTIVPSIYVGKSFHALNIDQKKVVVIDAYRFFKNKHPNIVVIDIFDGQTGKKLGKYSILGLNLE